MQATERAADLPFYLRGNFAPVTEEVTAVDLAVEGSGASLQRLSRGRRLPAPAAEVR